MKPFRLILSLYSIVVLVGCAGVSYRDTTPREYAREHSGDVLSTGEISVATRHVLGVAGVTLPDCERDRPSCLHALETSEATDDEQRLASESELWLAHAIANSSGDSKEPVSEEALGAYLESARAAYAYLFHTARTPADRPFEVRQAQVIAFYNYAAQRAITTFFVHLPPEDGTWPRFELGGWSWFRPDSDVSFGTANKVPSELIPAEALKFKGLWHEYRRDGFGATFVAKAPVDAGTAGTPDAPWRDREYAPLTGLLTFPGSTLEQVLATRDVQMLGRDPYDDLGLEINGRRVPIAANFTAAYGVWLARSGFSKQSIHSLLGKREGLAKPQVILMRPFNPDRLTIVMIHGLASSPEAWINAANSLLGNDEYIHRNYQVWQVYYPTNVPIGANTAEIRKALQATIAHVDPAGTSVGTQDMVLIGHSMGGVIARLLVSTATDQLWTVVPVHADYPEDKKRALREQLRPYVEFSPMPEFTRAIFLAAPHRGTPKAQIPVARWIRNIVNLPVELLQRNAEVLAAIAEASPLGEPSSLPNSIDELSDTNPFVMAASELPISPAVKLHTIVGVYKQAEGTPLAETSDGVVPYTSSHLSSVESELAVPSWHSVQETRGAILEMRRILRIHGEESGFPVVDAAVDPPQD